jgi:XTP/dITP diphosphohydrolase
MVFVLATRNRKKVDEMKRIFKGYDIDFQTLDAFPGCPDVEEDGKTFRANALKKSRAVARYTGCPALADDSGLAVDALDGAPGVYSARYAGKNADDLKNTGKLLREMKDLEDKERAARFVCCIAVAFPDGRTRTFTGYVKGTIGRKKRGVNGFGYDPVFFPDGYNKTFAEMSAGEKDALSHRGRALKKFYRYVKSMVSA